MCLGKGGHANCCWLCRLHGSLLRLCCVCLCAVLVCTSACPYARMGFNKHKPFLVFFECAPVAAFKMHTPFFPFAAIKCVSNKETEGVQDRQHCHMTRLPMGRAHTCTFSKSARYSPGAAHLPASPPIVAATLAASPHNLCLHARMMHTQGTYVCVCACVCMCVFAYVWCAARVEHICLLLLPLLLLLPQLLYSSWLNAWRMHGGCVCIHAL